MHVNLDNVTVEEYKLPFTLPEIDEEPLARNKSQRSLLNRKLCFQS